MSQISDISCRMILDSRGNPTVEVDCILSSAAAGRAAVPSGASTGEGEALELRDGGEAWAGKGVETALARIRDEIADELHGAHALDQEAIDKHLCQLDGAR